MVSDNTEHKKMMEALLKPPGKPKKSKAERKQINEELAAAKKRLDAKYIDKPRKSSGNSAKESKIWEQKRKQRYQERVWKGWRTKE